MGTLRDWLAITALLVMLVAFSQCTTQRYSAVLNDLLSPLKYDRRVRPNAGGSPVDVKVSVAVKDVYEFCEYSQSFTAHLYVETQWVDEQLAFNATDIGRSSLTLHAVDQIWQPDLFFSNSAREQQMEMPFRPLAAKIYFNGRVVLQQSFHVEFLCRMDVRRFPADQHVCPIILASYGYRTSDMILSWVKTPHPVHWQQKSLPNFFFQGITYEKSTSRTLTGEYDALKAVVTLRRSIRPYLPQLLAQPLFFVMASWITFWMSGRYAWLRMLLLMFLVLGHQAAVNRDLDVGLGLPIRAFDVWMFGCSVFLWAAVLEFGLKHIDVCKRKHEDDTTKDCDSDEDPQDMLRMLKRLFYDKDNKVDSTSRFVFPTFFVIFCVSFFASCYNGV